MKILSDRQQAHLARLAAAKRGKPQNEDTRLKISLANKGRQCSLESRQKMSAAHIGIIPSLETRRKRSASLKGMPKSAEHRAKLSLAKAGKPLTPEHRRNIALAGMGRVKSQQEREKLSRSVRFSLRAIAQRRTIMPPPSSLERIVFKLLSSLAVDHIPQYQIGPYVADIYIPQKQLVIECDGHYWHKFRAERDVIRDAYIRSQGFEVLRLSEEVIKSGEALQLLREAM